MTVIKSNLENSYHQYLGSSFDISKFNSGPISLASLFGTLVYNRLNQCALLCLKQIKCAAAGKKLLSDYKTIGVSFPIIIDSKNLDINPELKQLFENALAQESQNTSPPNIFDGDELNAVLSPYNLTPLHLAVIQGSHELAAAMVEGGLADVNAKDSRNWTPMHHAALKGDRAMLELLSKHHGDPAALNHRLGKPEDLLRLSSPGPIDDRQPLPLVVWQENHVQRPLTYGEFKQMTKADYITEYSVDPAILLNDWHENLLYTLNHVFFKNLKLKERYLEFKKNSPTLILERDPAVGFNVKTAVRLLRGQGVTQYLGVVSSSKDPQTNVEYQLDEFDGSQKRNLGPMINDGFPNVTSFPVRIDGTKRDFMFMVDDAKLGDHLCWNYTLTHPVKTSQPHAELRKDAMIEFFTQHKVKDLAQEVKAAFKAGKLEASKAMEIISKGEKLRYVIDTPTSLMILILSNILTLQEFESIFNDKELCNILKINHEIHNVYKKNVLPILNQFMPLLLLSEQYNTPQENLEFRQKLLSKLETLSFDYNFTIYKELVKSWSEKITHSEG